MKKQITVIFTIICLLSSMLVTPIYGIANDDKIETMQAIGVVESGYSNKLDKQITRAEFVNLMIKSSKYKDLVSSEGSGYSLFKDVKSSYWASEQIQIAIQEGWISGYIDGTFRPESQVKLEEACASLLNMLGYDASKLVGSFPNAQLSKASSIGLRDEIALKQGDFLTYRDSINLFYNLMISKNSQGQVYGTTLGYNIVNDEINYNSVIVDNLKGPYIAGIKDSLSFEPYKVYKNDKLVGSTRLNEYDVYYYNENMKTVWIYSEHISGKVTALTPNKTEPTSVTVAGNTYPITTSSAKYDLSILGGGRTGEVVTLLLGMNDDVVGVLKGREVDTTYYGVVQSANKALTTEGIAVVETYLKVFCTDGVVRTFAVDKDFDVEVGKLVSIDVSVGEIKAKKLSSKSSLSGTVNKSATRVGNKYLAEDIQIIDVAENGEAVVIDRERLSSVSLSSSDVRFYALNEDDEVEFLILNNATGDIWDYAYLTDIQDNSTELSFDLPELPEIETSTGSQLTWEDILGDMGNDSKITLIPYQMNITYIYMMNGMPQMYNSTDKSFPVREGGIAISYDSDGKIKTMRNMDSINITDLSALTVKANNKNYDLADNVQVYVKYDGNYYATTVDKINTENYRLTGWKDTTNGSLGGKIRMIIAVEK